jgi:hypothetical protein
MHRALRLKSAGKYSRKLMRNLWLETPKYEKGLRQCFPGNPEFFGWFREGHCPQAYEPQSSRHLALSESRSLAQVKPSLRKTPEAVSHPPNAPVGVVL